MSKAEVSKVWDEGVVVLPVALGDVVAGKYRVDRVLGQGGMGVVVAATHLELDQAVALKFLLPGGVLSGQARARFRREARASAQLSGENSVRVLDVGALPGGAPYIVMELLAGSDLADVIAERGPLPLADAARYVVDACRGLAEAHARGIVHRDLKPRNLFVMTTPSGQDRVKVLDFGISKFDRGPDDHALTTTNAVMGSPSYMSPEQIRKARDVDARTDIWSLGAVLHEALTGSPPFVAETLPHLCALVLESQPQPLRGARPDLPEAVEAIVARCLAKDPADRFPSADALAEALAPFFQPSLRNVSAPAPVAGPLVVDATVSAGAAKPGPSRGSGRIGQESTGISWDDTALAPAPAARRVRGRALAAAAVAAMAALGVGVALRVRHGQDAQPAPRADGVPLAPSTEVSLASVVDVAKAAPPTSTNDVAPAADAALASSGADASRRPSTRPGPTPTRGSRADAAPTPASPTPAPGDSLPDERK